MEMRRRRAPVSRRLSIIVGGASDGCNPLPHSLEALDLPYTSLAPTLASLRHQVLSYLADLEASLAELDSPISSDKLKATGELTVEEARAWAREGLEMLRAIRQEVYAHIPEIHLDQVPSVELFVKSHIPDLPDVRAHLPDMPDAVRSRLPDVRSRLDDMRTRISELGSHRPLRYIPTLTERLHSLQTHLSSIDIPQALSQAAFSPNSTVSALLERVRSSALVSEISSEIRHGEDKLEEAALEIARAVKRSLDGSRLIQYVDLPEQWRNNPFVTGGYRSVLFLLLVVRITDMPSHQIHSFGPMAATHFLTFCIAQRDPEYPYTFDTFPYTRIHSLTTLECLSIHPDIRSARAGHTRACVHGVCHALSLLQLAMAHDGRLCAPPRYGPLCSY